MLGLRVLSVVVGAPLVLLAVWLGGWALLSLVALLLGAACIELMGLMHQPRPPRVLVLAGALALLAGAYLSRGEYFPGAAVVLFITICLVSMVIFYPRFSPQACAATLFTTLYPGLLVYLYLLRLTPSGWMWALFAVTTTWAFDTAGYLVGHRWGRHRMTPVLSPGKTVEGFCGGLAGALLVAFGLYFLFQAPPVWVWLVLGGAVAVAAQVGDLVASAVKRFANVKDTGKLIPGHGGVLDRFDSMLLTLPLVYHTIRIFGMGG
ncbi:MAG: phosphatidate cytidylyltransferase [Bacillota bacterium]